MVSWKLEGRVTEKEGGCQLLQIEDEQGIWDLRRSGNKAGVSFKLWVQWQVFGIVNQED